MKRSISKTKKMLTGVLILVMIALAAFFTFRPVKAASLTNITVTLTDSTISATNVGVAITFTPNTPITNGSKINVSYDPAFTGGSSLSNADIDITGSNISSSSESNFLAGSFESTLTTSANQTSAVTITIDASPGLNNPDVSGNYNWSLTVDIGETGSVFDTGAGLAYIGNANQVAVTALVRPVLDMALFSEDSTSLLADPNTCSLGTVTISSVSTCVYDLGFGTNNSAGITVKVTSDGPLSDGTDTINCSGTNCNSDGASGVTGGSAEYGFVITDIGSGCSTNTVSPYSTVDQAVPTSPTNLITSSSTCDGTNPSNISERIEITHKASVSASTPAGTYDQLVTYTLFTN